MPGWLWTGWMGNPKTAQNRYLARMTTRDTPHVYVRVRWGGGVGGLAMPFVAKSVKRIVCCTGWGGAMECELME